MDTPVKHLLFLIVLANGAPILLRYVLSDRFNWPIDFGFCLTDGKPIFGNSKTWRGVVATVAVTPPTAVILGYSFETGLKVAFWCIFGDLASSFIKRRLGMDPSSMAPLLDQIPESLLPAVLMMHVFMLDFSSVIILVVAFVTLELLLSSVLFRLGIRKRPY